MVSLCFALTVIIAAPHGAPVKKAPSLLSPPALCKKYGVVSRYCVAGVTVAPRVTRFLGAVSRAFKKRFGTVSALGARVRKASLLPSIAVEYGRWDDSDISYSTKPGEDLWQDQVAGVRQLVRIRLTWEPRLLLFDPNEIIILREKRKEALLRETQLDRSRRLFFKWRRELLLFKRRPSLGRLLNLEELESALDILSGGSFSRMLPGT